MSPRSNTTLRVHPWDTAVTPPVHWTDENFMQMFNEHIAQPTPQQNKPKEETVKTTERFDTLDDLLQYASDAIKEGIKCTEELREAGSLQDSEELKIAMFLSNYDQYTSIAILDTLELGEEKRANIMKLSETMPYEYYKFKAGMFIVILKNPNSHNYTKGKVYKIRPSDPRAGIGADGFLGNIIPTGIRDIRPATDEEIAKWVAESIQGELVKLCGNDSDQQVAIVNFLEQLKNTIKGE